MLTRLCLVFILLQKSINSTSSTGSSGHCYSTTCFDKTKTSTQKQGEQDKTQEFYVNYSFPIYPVTTVYCRSADALKIIAKAVGLLLMTFICNFMLKIKIMIYCALFLYKNMKYRV